jgi:hypothetical protein
MNERHAESHVAARRAVSRCLALWPVILYGSIIYMVVHRTSSVPSSVKD